MAGRKGTGPLATAAKEARRLEVPDGMTEHYETPQGALVRRAEEGHVAAPSPDLMELLYTVEQFKPEARQLLERYLQPPFSIQGAAKALDFKVHWHRMWIGSVPGYKEAYAEAQEIVRELWRGAFEDVTYNGLKRILKDGEGQIIQQERRQSEGLWKLQMSVMDPEYRMVQDGKEGARNIQVNINMEGPRYEAIEAGGVEIVQDED